MWIVVIGLGAVVAYLAMKCNAQDAAQAQSSTPTGVVVDASTPTATGLPPNTAIPFLGNNPAPSPAGGPNNSSQLFRMMQGPNQTSPSRKGVKLGFVQPPKGSGLANPLPSRETRSKQLSTQVTYPAPVQRGGANGQASSGNKIKF